MFKILNAVVAETFEVGAAIDGEVGRELGRLGDSFREFFGVASGGGFFFGSFWAELVVVPVAASDGIHGAKAEAGVAIKAVASARVILVELFEIAFKEIDSLFGSVKIGVGGFGFLIEKIKNGVAAFFFEEMVDEFDGVAGGGVKSLRGCGAVRIKRCGLF